jgi:hypothetical protein
MFPPDARSFMSPMTEKNEALWPSAACLMACLSLVLAGYGVGILRGTAPEIEVLVKTVEQSETTEL